MCFNLEGKRWYRDDVGKKPYIFRWDEDLVLPSEVSVVPQMDPQTEFSNDDFSVDQKKHIPKVFETPASSQHMKR